MFGVVLIGSILASEYSFVALLLALTGIGQFELNRLLRSPAIGFQPQTPGTYVLSYLVFLFFLVGIVLEGSYGLRPMHLKWGLSLGIFAFSFFTAVELFRKSAHAAGNWASLWFGPMILALPLGCLLLVSVNQHGGYEPWRVLFFFFFMWASDTGAYFSGRAFGKHKLFERHSPKKTWEGFFGGMAVAALTGIAAWKVLGQLPMAAWMGIGALMAVSGTMGDLLESMLKRQAGIKDSGNLLPGHGGVLDRFDSTFFSAPLYWAAFGMMEAW